MIQSCSHAQVDIVLLGIPDYPKIIKRPMDYGTINTKLDRREYRTAEDCLNDILQVSKNAKTFNPPGTQFMPTVMCDDFLRGYKGFLGG